MKKARDGSALQAAAMGVSVLASLPAAYMVGRSVYHWLVLGWFEQHTLFWPWLGAAIAVASAVVIEGLGTVSLFLWSTFRRWNRWRAVRDDGTLKRGYDLAPERLALACFVVYLLVAASLLGVLEWRSDLARFAPVLFPALTAVGGMAWTMMEEHRDRLTYHGLAWNWVALPAERDETETERREPEVERVPQLDGTDRAILQQWAKRPGLSQAEVGQGAGCSKSTVHRRAKELEAAGLLARDGDLVRVLWSGNGSKE